MPIGTSGRVVVELDPELKEQLHAALKHNGLTMKEWFVQNAEQFLYENVQLAFRLNGDKSEDRRSQ